MPKQENNKRMNKHKKLTEHSRIIQKVKGRNPD
jgi:hypothetical protein